MGCDLRPAISKRASKGVRCYQCLCNITGDSVHHQVSLDCPNLFLKNLFFRPPFIFGYDSEFVLDQQYYIAGAIVFAGSVVFQSNVYILLRKLKGIHFSVTLFVFGAIGTIESAIFMFTIGKGCIPACGQDR